MGADRSVLNASVLPVYLEGDVLSEGDIPGHGEVVQLQHVWDVLETLQKVLNLEPQRPD